MKVINARDGADKPNPHGVSAKVLHENPHAVVLQITLEAGQSLRLHTTPVDVFFYVLEGSGIVQVGEEQREVHVDDLIDSPKGIPHRLLNPGDGRFRFLVVKTPKPGATA